ncbi:MAG: hypothetical protein ACOC6F_01200 [bacterium]
MSLRHPKPIQKAQVAKSADWFAVIWILLISITTALVYGSSLEFFFSQDDFVFLVRAARVGSWGDLVSSFLMADQFYRPVPRTVVFTGLFKLLGLNARAFHLVSLGLHAANGILFFLLYRRLFPGKRYLPGISGLAFAGHQIPFLAVYWVSGIQDLCVTTFLLLSLHFYLKSGDSEAIPWRILSLLTYALGLLSKEIAITFPAILLLVELIGQFRCRERFSLADSMRKLLSYGLLVAGYLLLRASKSPEFLPSEGPYSWSMSPTIVLDNLWTYVCDALYLRDWLNAVPQQACGLCLVLLAVLIVSALLSRRGWVALLLGTGWFVISLLPVLFLTERTYSFYAYFSLGGIALVLAVPADMLLSHVGHRSLRVRHSVEPTCGLSDLATALFIATWLWFSVSQIKAEEVRDPAGIISKSIAAREALTEIQTLYPELPRDSTLYVTALTDRDIWAFGHGDLFRLYYPQTKVIISPEEDLAPVSDATAFVYRFRKSE